MPRDPIATYFYALTVVRRDDRFLVVQETKHDQLWYLPGGAVEPGESLAKAARRETLEESGVPVVIEGVLRIEFTSRPDRVARCRVFFLAHPVDDTPPKTVPDAESLGAAFVTLEELDRLPLRSAEVREAFRSVVAGAPVFPLSCLVAEGAPWTQRS